MADGDNYGRSDVVEFTVNAAGMCCNTTCVDMVSVPLDITLSGITGPVAAILGAAYNRVLHENHEDGRTYGFAFDDAVNLSPFCALAGTDVHRDHPLEGRGAW